MWATSSGALPALERGGRRSFPVCLYSAALTSDYLHSASNPSFIAGELPFAIGAKEVNIPIERTGRPALTENHSDGASAGSRTKESTQRTPQGVLGHATDSVDWWRDLGAFPHPEESR